MNNTLPEESRKEIGVYLLHNEESGLGYIGSGVLGNRQKAHDYLLRNGKHWNHRLQQAYNQNPNFDFLAVVVGSNTDEVRREALALEQAWIDEHWGAPQLLNLAADVETPMRGYKHSLEAIEKNRQAAKERWRDPVFREGVIAAQKAGRAAMTETQKQQIKEKISQGLKRFFTTLDHSPTFGQQRSAEFCLQNSRKISEKWQDPSYRESQRKAHEGKQVISSNSKAVSVNGVVYESITAAAEAHGITKQGAKYRTETASFPEWKLERIQS